MIRSICVLALLSAAMAWPQMSAASDEEGIMPLPTTRAELSKRLEVTGLSAAATKIIVAASRNALVMQTASAAENTIAVGASKFGGLPDLPNEMAWPIRDAYADATELAREYESEAANLYADAGHAPPWMPKAEGEEWRAARKKLNDDAMAGTIEIMKKAGVDLSTLDLGNIPKASLEDIEKEAVILRAKAQAVTKPFPLTFIAQIELGPLSDEAGFDAALPKTGRLLLFYDLPIIPAGYKPSASNGWHVIYDETPAPSLKRADHPPIPAEFQTEMLLRPATVSVKSVVTTIPSGGASWFALEGIGRDDALLYHEWLYTLGWPTADAGGNHQLGGWPLAIQANMQTQSQLASNGIDAGSSEAYESEVAKRLLQDAKDWRLVMQIGTDVVIGQNLPGALYVLMREQDLQARQFGRAWVIYEQD